MHRWAARKDEIVKRRKENIDDQIAKQLLLGCLFVVGVVAVVVFLIVTVIKVWL